MPSSLLLLLGLASMITAQNLGDPALLSTYPSCAQVCGATVQSSNTNPCAPTNNLTCLCSAEFLADSVACEKVSCSTQDYDTTQTLRQQLCNPTYPNKITPSSVSAAIASATAAAAAAVEGKDVTKTASWPACAQSCQQQNIPNSGCGSLANVSCVCHNTALADALGSCEDVGCNAQDRRDVGYLAFKYCAPAGGVGNATQAVNQTVATQTPGAGIGSTGTSVPFTGNAAGTWSGSLAWGAVAGGIVMACFLA